MRTTLTVRFDHDRHGSDESLKAVPMSAMCKHHLSKSVDWHLRMLESLYTDLAVIERIVNSMERAMNKGLKINLRSLRKAYIMLARQRINELQLELDHARYQLSL